MKISIVITSLLFYSSILLGQNTNKIKIYVKTEIDSSIFKIQKEYSKAEKGYVFIDKSRESFLFSDNCKADTLSISKLKNYKVFSIEEIRKMEKKWRKERFKEVQKKNKETGTYNLPIHTFDKNYIFETYLIEIISDQQFVVYPVKWRGQGIKM
ncbi:hypothetical protein [Flavobacterium sp. HNIBRBA15423]|uniref:hypothetical protein n=1 Tax=Flavobacterium sp. HNIBRBA15423 TaxID=3458683 RepID=UPI004044861C